MFMLLDFVQRPLNQTVAQGQVAIFKCQVESALAQSWSINGTKITNENVPEGVVRKQIGSEHTLEIEAQHDYNLTVVECDAHYERGSNAAISSPLAFMIIQGVSVCRIFLLKRDIIAIIIHVHVHSGCYPILQDC